MSDYKQRMIEEYKQLKERTNKLSLITLTKIQKYARPFKNLALSTCRLL
ncbi:phage protein [Streptococcus pneumoniae]|nr:phage protein [Streptococcus pneumoniae]